MQNFLDDTGFLFATPTFWSGAATAFDVSGTLVEYNISRNEADADTRAIASDWAVVGKDIQNSVEQYKIEKENETSAK